MRVEPYQRRARESLAKIADSAERLIADSGQVDFIAADLAGAAGMSIGRVYYYFDGLPEVVAFATERIVADMDAIKPSPSARRLIDQICLLVEAHPAMMVIAVTGQPNGPRQAITDALVRLCTPCTPDTATPEMARALAAIIIDHHRPGTDTRAAKAAAIRMLVTVATDA